MKTNLPRPTLLLATLLALILISATALANYPDPPGGWTYKYNGDQLLIGPGYPNADPHWDSLDGTWTHDNNSDAWDGSEIGGDFSLTFNATNSVRNRPGGASLGTQSGAAYLRMQDPGDPTDYDTAAAEYADPSNRKVYFGHAITNEVALDRALTILDTGVTLTFRARVPTLAKAGPPLDPLHRDGQQASGMQSYPTNGDGYVTSDGGKGNFVIRQGGDGTATHPAAAIAFSFTQTTDTTGGNPATGQAGFAGLTFNEFAGNVPQNAPVNFGQGTKTNLVPFDPTDWHELYILIRDDPADIGTHEAFIFRDDSLVPIVFKITGGTGSDMPESFLAMGGSATPQNWALDVDWFGYKDEAVFPPGALLPPSIFGFAPPDRTLFHPAASGLRFSTSALMPTNTLPASGIKMIVNGQDVSGQLVLTGSDTSQSRTVTYNGLQANRTYAATYIVTDSGGLSSTNDISFDTFAEAQLKLLEAEEYNFGGGQFIDNPAAGGYGAQAGTAGVDFQDTTPNDVSAYRGDAVDSAAAADLARTKYTSSGQTDYQVASIVDGEWWNYTAVFTNAPYHMWLRYASTAARQIRVDRVTGDSAQTNQTLQFVGVFNATSSGGLNRYTYVQLTDVQGNPVVLPFSGTNTYRLTALGANNDIVLNFLFFVPGAAPLSTAQVTVTPLPNSTDVRADAPVEATIYDGSTPVTESSVKLRIGGSEVPAQVTKSGGITTVNYSPSPLWAPSTTFNLSLTYNDGTDRTNSWSFTTAAYPVLTPAMKASNPSVPGFVWRMHQNEGNQETTVQKALNALSGALGLANLADPNAQGPASGPGTPANPGNGTMTFNIPTVINVSEVPGDLRGTFTPDDQMPGIPGTTFSDEGIAVEITAFIQLTSGFHTMVVNSDDGFRTTAGFLNDTPLTLGILDAGRGAADSVFNFAVQEAGVYAFRTIYFEGGGDASIEWLMIKPDGSRVLINDTANGGPAAFQQGTIPTGPPTAVTLSIAKNAGGQIVLQWSSGTLEASDNVASGYTTVTNATSPHVVNPTDPRKFYRVRVQ
jgi:hypothetical protein